jgi:hypothetical protein
MDVQQVQSFRYSASEVKMKVEEGNPDILGYPTISKTAIANDREYQTTQAELANFEQQLAAVNREDPSLHPRLILGRINNFQRTIDRLKQELAEYEQHNSGKIA